MKTKKKILSIVAILGLILWDLSPLITLAEVNQPKDNNLPIAVNEAIQDNNLAEDLKSDTDWSLFDWDSDVILLSDKEEYNKKVNQLVDEGKSAEIEKVQVKQRKMSDDVVLDYYNVPKQIQKFVKDYRTVKSKEKVVAKQKLKSQIKSWSLTEDIDLMVNNSIDKELKSDQIIDLNSVEKLDLKKYFQRTI